MKEDGEQAALTEIIYQSCALKNKRGMAKLFTEELAKSLRTCSGGIWFQYDPNKGAAYYALSDGDWASCLTVTEISQEGAERILAEIESGSSSWGESQFRAALVKSLGATIETMQ
jgi:hypothetical protein